MYRWIKTMRSIEKVHKKTPALRLNSYFGLSLFDPRLNKSPETEFLLQKLKYSETQGNFPKTQAKFFKNSIYRKVHSPALPPKRRKKTLKF